MPLSETLIGATRADLKRVASPSHLTTLAVKPAVPGGP
jgi:hypothetical protein